MCISFQPKRQEQRLRAAEKAASDAQVVVEELQKENATLRGLLDLEKETFKRIEFDVVSAQALCSNINVTMKQFHEKLAVGTCQRHFMGSLLSKLTGLFN